MEPTLGIVEGGQAHSASAAPASLMSSPSFTAPLLFPRRPVRTRGQTRRATSTAWAISRDSRRIGTSREISITEVDIDSFIRAKAAIFSAINIHAFQSRHGRERFCLVMYVAGGIGSGINMENAVRIGMLPDIDRELFEYLGNTSLSGAYAMARSDCAVDKVDELASNMTYMELSTNSQIYG